MTRMSRQEFRKWAEEQDGRYELVAGEPVAMAPERVVHARLKARIWQAFDREIRERGLACEALPDGVTVEIGEDCDYDPDAIVNCGERLPPDAIAAPSPVIVVEVLSPSSAARDMAAKLADYFSLPSVRHYLILGNERRTIIHHRRGRDGAIETRLVSSGKIDLAPPGIVLDADEIYEGIELSGRDRPRRADRRPGS
jgi:Uma2 family endonuclease